MTHRKMLGEYRRLNVGTAGKLDLVLMCYEKTIEVIRQGKEHLQKQEYEKKADKIQKAIDIIHELQNCLNFEQGGQIARNLDSIYSYVVRRLLEGDAKKDARAYEEVIGILSELKEAWEGVAKDRETNGIMQKTRTGLSLDQLAA